MNTIKEILGEKYLKKFEVVHYGLLFPPAWEALKEGRCPMCNNKLSIPKSGKIVFCKGRKHGKAFVLTVAKFTSIKEKYGRT